MISLIRLELRKNNVRAYLTGGIVISMVMLGFLYLFAYAPQLDPQDKDMEIFSRFTTLIPLFGALSMTAFCVLSAVMHAKFVIEDYSGKRPLLHFCYPVSRSRILLAKLIVITLITLLFTVISHIVIFMIFGITETFFHLVGEVITPQIIKQAALTTILMAVMAASIGIIAARIGFIKKSVPTVIITAVIASSLICNIAANASSNTTTMALTALAMAAAGVLCSFSLIRRVNSMEVQ